MIDNCVFLDGVRIYLFSSVEELLDTIEYERKILIAVNYQKTVHSTMHMKSIINQNIGYVDGAWLAIALKKRGCGVPVQIPGYILWLKIVERYYKTKTFYLIGSKQNVIDEVVEKLKEQFPGINIVNYRNGYFNDVEKRELFLDLKEKKPDIVFVAMGTPEQELLMEEMIAVHPALYQGLGGSFDVYTNNYKSPAPQWWIDHKLEWAYYTIMQPSRIGRLRYLFKYLKTIFFGQLYKE
jgi:UDP-N-acetyl-D-mannosaminouronate:lipid I N-acetyl-D-mannosaminouronosyltransferase